MAKLDDVTPVEEGFGFMVRQDNNELVALFAFGEDLRCPRRAREDTRHPVDLPLGMVTHRCASIGKPRRTQPRERAARPVPSAVELPSCDRSPPGTSHRSGTARPYGKRADAKVPTQKARQLGASGVGCSPPSA